MRRPLNLLLVEDSPTQAMQLLGLMATDKAITAEVVPSLKESRCRLGLGGIDAVVLDLFLTDAQEVEAVKGIRTAHPDLPIVVVTASGNEEIEGKVLEMGAQDYFDKTGLKGPDLLRGIRHAVIRHDVHDQVAKDFAASHASLTSTECVIKERKEIEKQWEEAKK